MSHFLAHTNLPRMIFHSLSPPMLTLEATYNQWSPQTLFLFFLFWLLTNLLPSDTWIQSCFHLFLARYWLEFCRIQLAFQTFILITERKKKNDAPLTFCWGLHLFICAFPLYFHGLFKCIFEKVSLLGRGTYRILSSDFKWDFKAVIKLRHMNEVIEKRRNMEQKILCQ